MNKRKRKEQIIEFAKELYLTPDSSGKHEYSLQNICEEIKQKFNKTFTRTTILNWAERYGWKQLWNQAVREGITQAIAKEKADKEKTKEEQFQERIAEAKKNDFIMNTNLKVLAYKFIKEHGFTSVGEALKAFEIGMRNTQDLADMSNGEQAQNLADFLLKNLKE